MSGLNWWSRLGLVMCVVATVGVVSGCEFNMDNLRNSSQWNWGQDYCCRGSESFRAKETS